MDVIDHGRTLAVAREEELEIGFPRRYRTLAHRADVADAHDSTQPIWLTTRHPPALDGLTCLLTEQRAIGPCKGNGRPTRICSPMNETRWVESKPASLLQALAGLSGNPTAGSDQSGGLGSDCLSV